MGLGVDLSFFDAYVCDLLLGRTDLLVEALLVRSDGEVSRMR